MAKKKPDIGWSIVGGLSGLVAGVVAKKLLELTWTKATGNKPPSMPESPDVAFREAVLWAVATGVSVGVARLVVTREAAKAWQRATGELPAAFREAAEKAAEKLD